MPAGRHPELTFYPQYCYSQSPTWFKWVKVTAFDIHNILSTNDGSQNTRPARNYEKITSLGLFWLNHPIRFVAIAGVVVAVEDYNEKRWIFTIDDSSGATIDVVYSKPEGYTTKNVLDAKAQKPAQVILDAEGKVRTRVKAVSSAKRKGDDTGKTRDKNGETNADEARRIAVLHSLDIGAVLQVKGTVTNFRSTHQISLERLSILSSTTHEMNFVEERTRFLRETLSKPWTIATKQQQECLQEQETKKRQESDMVRNLQERATKRQKREDRDAQDIQAQWTEEEKMRDAAAKKAKILGAML